MSYTVSPGIVNFSSAFTGVIDYQTITVTNTDASNAIIFGSSSGLAAPYALASDNVSGATIHPGDSSTFMVKYTRASIGASNDTVDMTCNDATGTYSINVDGTCVALPTGGRTGMGLMLSLASGRSSTAREPSYMRGYGDGPFGVGPFGG